MHSTATSGTSVKNEDYKSILENPSPETSEKDHESKFGQHNIKNAESVPLLSPHQKEKKPPEQKLEEYSASSLNPDATLKTTFSSAEDIYSSDSNLEETTTSFDNKQKDLSRRTKDSSDFIKKFMTGEIDDLFSRLTSSKRATEPDKQKATLLKNELIKIILYFGNKANFNEDDTADIIYSIINEAVANLRLIADCLENKELPNTHITHLYDLVRLQSCFYFSEFPHSQLRTMIEILKNPGNSVMNHYCTGKALEKTEWSIQLMIDKSSAYFDPQSDIMSEQKINSLTSKLQMRVNNLDIKTGPYIEWPRLSFGIRLNVYKYMTLTSSEFRFELFSNFLQLTKEEQNEGIFKALNEVFIKLHTPLIAQFTSLLVLIDKHGKNRSPDQQLNYLKAETWASYVIETILLKGDKLREDDIKEIMGKLQEIEEKLQEIEEKLQEIDTNLGFNPDPSVFFKKLIMLFEQHAERATGSTDIATYINNNLDRAIGEWMIDVFFQFYPEILGKQQKGSKEAEHIQSLQQKILEWVNDGNEKYSRKLEDIHLSILETCTLLAEIKSGFKSRSKEPLIKELIETAFKQSARSFLLENNISSADITSPITQLQVQLLNLRSIFNEKNREVFRLSKLREDYVRSKKQSDDRPIEQWQLNFVETILNSRQQSKQTIQDESLDQKKSNPFFFARNLKRASALGALLLKVDKGIADRVAGKWYHEEHDTNGWAEPFCIIDIPNTVVPEESDNNEKITKSWKSRPWTFPRLKGWTANNHLFDSDANHSDKGELEENTGGLEFALPSKHVMKNWYTAFKVSALNFFSKDQGDDRPRYSTLRHLNSLADSRSSLDDDHGNFLLDVLSTMINIKPGCEFEKKIKQSISNIGKKTYSEMAPKVISPPKIQHSPLKLQPTAYKKLSPFFRSIAKEITRNSFMHDITADIYSVQIFQQIIGFLDMPVEISNKTMKMYGHLDLDSETFEYLNVYFIRLSSEYFQHKTDLLGERLYEMSSERPKLTIKQTTFLDSLENQGTNGFLSEVENYIKAHNTKPEKTNLGGMKEILDSVKNGYQEVIKNLVNDKKNWKDNSAPEISTHDDEINVNERIKQIDSKIEAGKTLLKNLEATIEALQLGNEKLAPESRWTQFCEWIEENEAWIMGAYCMAMGASIYYLAHGEFYDPHHYTFGSNAFNTTGSTITTPTANSTGVITGGELPFGSFDARYTSIDAFQVVTTTGAILTQFAQASGWKNDIRRMTELYQNASALSFAASNIPSQLQNDMLNLYAAKYNPVKDKDGFEITCRYGNYYSDYSSKEFLKDAAASFLTRKTPLQESRPLLDRCLRIAGGATTGAASGAAYAGFTTAFSACAASWLPTINIPASYIIGGSSITGAVGGCFSGTRLDHVSRGLNYSSRVFGDDRILGGIGTLVKNAIMTMKNRKDSTLIRLLIENPLKAGLNVFGFSIPESVLKFILHVFDGFIAQIEIGDFAEWRKSHQKLLSVASAVNKAFEGKELNAYDLNNLKDALGEKTVEELALTARPGSKAESAHIKRKLAGILNLFGHYVMLADLCYYTYEAIKKGIKADPENCEADTSKLPEAGEGKFECALATYEAWRKKEKLKRFVGVAAFKSIPNAARYLDVQGHNFALGKKSNDSAMVVTAKAGAAKNTVLGPAERLMQLSDSILLKCIGDVINQLNTNVKEAMESAGQRDRDKATEALKKAAKDIYWKLLIDNNYDLPKTEVQLVAVFKHWQEKFGFESLNSLAKMRQHIAREKLKECDASGENRDFPDYKKDSLKKIQEALPSMTDTTFPSPDRYLQAEIEEVREAVNHFFEDIDNGNDMSVAFMPLRELLSRADKRIFDLYLQSKVMEPLLQKLPQHVIGQTNTFVPI